MSFLFTVILSAVKNPFAFLRDSSLRSPGATFVQNGKKGFTLVEALVALGIGVIVIFGAMELYLTSWRVQNSIAQRLNAEQEVRRVFKDITAELRTAVPSSTGGYSLEKVADQEIIFYTNLDADASRERVRYFVSGTTLKKGVVKPTGAPPVYNLGSETVSEVLHGVANGMAPLFKYYDQNYSGTQNPLIQPVGVAVVRVVGIDLNIKPATDSTAPPFKLQTTVQIRNLKSN